MSVLSLIFRVVGAPLSVVGLAAVILTAGLLLPQQACSECKEYKVVEFEDRMEAVCVGEPLTDAQKKANLEEDKRQQEAVAANKTQAESERRKRVTPPQTPDRNRTNTQRF